MRTTRRHVTFQHPFNLRGIENVLPPGSYEVETDEELINSASFYAYRRLGTTIRVEPSNGVTQMYMIDPVDLEAALLRDGGRACGSALEHTSENGPPAS